MQQNDPALTLLKVNEEGEYFPRDSAHLARLDDAIGWNMHLRRLFIRDTRGLTEIAANNGVFFKGPNHKYFHQ